MFIDSTVVRYKTIVVPLLEIWSYSHHPETCFIILPMIAVLLFWLGSEQKRAAGGMKRPHSFSVPIIYSFAAEESPKKKKRKTSLLFLAMLSMHHIAKGYVYFIQSWFPSHQTCCFCWGCRQLLVGADSCGEGERILGILLCISSELSNYNKSKLSGRLNAVDRGRLGSGCSTHYRWKRKWLSAVAVITPIDPLATKAQLSNKGQKRLIYLSFPSSLSQMLLHVPLFSLSLSFFFSFSLRVQTLSLPLFMLFLF